MSSYISCIPFDLSLDQYYVCGASLSLSPLQLSKDIKHLKKRLDIEVTHHRRRYTPKKKKKGERDLHWVGGIPVNVAEPVSRCGRLADQFNEQQQEVDDHFG